MIPSFGYVTVHGVNPTSEVVAFVAQATGGDGEGMPTENPQLGMSGPFKNMEPGAIAVAPFRCDAALKLDTYVYVINRGAVPETVSVRWHGPGGGVGNRTVKIPLNPAQTGWTAASNFLTAGE